MFNNKLPTYRMTIISIIQFNDLKLEYKLSGKKHATVIMFVHGLGANLTQFEKQHEFFEKSFRVLSVNLRGYGNSLGKKEFGKTDFQLPNMAVDLIKLLDALHLEQVHFVGNSMGGNIGYELLKQTPNRLLSFTTFGTTSKLNKSSFSIWFLRALFGLMGQKAIASLSSLSGNTVYAKKMIREMYAETPKSTILNTIPNLATFNYLITIQDSKVPMLIIKGEKDNEINNELDSTIKAFKKRGNFTLKSIPQVGHFVNLDSPELFNETLLRFIENQKR